MQMNTTVATNFNMALRFYSPFLHDFAGKGEYNVIIIIITLFIPFT